MKNFNCLGSALLPYKTPVVDDLGSFCSTAMCASANNQEFEDGGEVNWFN